jgi:hypothetical protein
LLLKFELLGEGDYNIGRWGEELQLEIIEVSGIGVSGIEIALISAIFDGVFKEFISSLFFPFVSLFFF